MRKWFESDFEFDLLGIKKGSIMSIDFKFRKKIKVNFDCAPLNIKKGAIISIDFNENDVPVDRFWSRRFQDAKRDNCIEVIEPKKPAKEEKKKGKSKSEAEQ